MPDRFLNQLFVFSSLLCGAGCVVFVLALAHSTAKAQIGNKSRPKSPAKSALVPQTLSPKEVAARSLPSVVLITMTDAQGRARCTGSGFVVRLDLVVTNKHVTDCGTQGRVKVVGGERDHTITSMVVDNNHDLALVEVNGLSAPALPVATDDKLSVGDDVFVVGNPEGYEGTFSRGIVSALRARGNLIQIDAAISMGSSGGPVMDVRGRVVGVAVAINSRGQNLNFAVPAAYVSRLMTTVHRGGAGDRSGTGRESRNQLKRVPSPGRVAPHDNATPWLTLTGKGNDFTIEFPAKPLHEYKEPHLLSNKRIEEYLHCADGFCLYAASIKFESGIQNAKAHDQITPDKDEVHKLMREANGWKTTRVMRLSADSYEVEGLAPWVGNGVLAPIIQRVIERNGQTYKLECRVMPGHGELDGEDREVCKRFLDSFRPSVIPQSPQPPQSLQPTKP